MISLTDTSDDSIDLHLDEWMIENELAVRGKMVCIINNFAFVHYTTCLAKKGCSLLSNKSYKKNSEIPDGNNIEMVDTIINTQFDYHAKMAAIEQYKKRYCTSSESSTSEEIVIVHEQVTNDKVCLYNESLFQRYKQLDRETSNYPKFNETTNSKKKENQITNHDEKLEKMKSRLISLKMSNNGKNNVIQKNGISNCDFEIYDINSFYGINGGHGRMGPIDWSVVNKK